MIYERDPKSLARYATFINMEGICETGPTVCSPYPRRLERLTICSYFELFRVKVRPEKCVAAEQDNNGNENGDSSHFY